jgi:hypothetical protein
MLGNYRVAAQLVASRVVLSSTELFKRYWFKFREWVFETTKNAVENKESVHISLQFIKQTSRAWRSSGNPTPESNNKRKVIIFQLGQR